MNDAQGESCARQKVHVAHRDGTPSRSRRAARARGGGTLGVMTSIASMSFEPPNDAPEDASEPLSFMCWNADGLTRKLKSSDGRAPRSVVELRSAVISRAPDVIAMQEVWLKAQGGGATWCVDATRGESGSVLRAVLRTTDAGDANRCAR